MTHTRRITNQGFTLTELLLVLLTLAVVGTLAIPQLSGHFKQSQVTITSVSLRRIRQVVLDEYRDNMFERLPYPEDATRQQHPQLNYLYVNPEDFAAGPSTVWSYDISTMRGWSGPYLSESGRYTVDASRGFADLYGETGDQAPLDAWGNPIILQQPVVSGSDYSATSLLSARLVSAGPNGVIDTPLSAVTPTASQQADDLVLFLNAN